MAPPRDDRDRLARDAWRMMFDYLVQSGPGRAASLARRGLSPNDSRALFALAGEPGRTMRSLAEEWRCDPSNATLIVDRLESLGLAERRTGEPDRRVKRVVLTAKGRRTRGALLREFHEPPRALAQLDISDLECLRRVMRKLLTGDPRLRER